MGRRRDVNRVRYLADTSVFARLAKPAVAAAFGPLAAEGQVALCAPVAFELGYAARNPADHRTLLEHLHAFPTAPVNDADHRRALAVQHVLLERGQHRAVSLVDGLVAAVAEARDLTVLHYDADFELVAAVTDQPHAWVVPRGTAD
jgi:predicted nucleic acid-binding protein